MPSTSARSVSIEHETTHDFLGFLDQEIMPYAKNLNQLDGRSRRFRVSKEHDIACLQVLAEIIEKLTARLARVLEQPEQLPREVGRDAWGRCRFCADFISQYSSNFHGLDLSHLSLSFAAKTLRETAFSSISMALDIINLCVENKDKKPNAKLATIQVGPIRDIVRLYADSLRVATPLGGIQLANFDETGKETSNPIRETLSGDSKPLGRDINRNSSMANTRDAPMIIDDDDSVDGVLSYSEQIEAEDRKPDEDVKYNNAVYGRKLIAKLLGGTEQCTTTAIRELKYLSRKYKIDHLSCPRHDYNPDAPHAPTVPGRMDFGWNGRGEGVFLKPQTTTVFVGIEEHKSKMFYRYMGKYKGERIEWKPVETWRSFSQEAQWNLVQRALRHHSQYKGRERESGIHKEIRKAFESGELKVPCVNFTFIEYDREFANEMDEAAKALEQPATAPPPARSPLSAVTTSSIDSAPLSSASTARRSIVKIEATNEDVRQLRGSGSRRSRSRSVISSSIISQSGSEYDDDEEDKRPVLFAKRRRINIK